jgi:hypothetical protein
MTVAYNDALATQKRKKIDCLKQQRCPAAGVSIRRAGQ